MRSRALLPSIITSLNKQKWTDDESSTRNWGVGWILATPLDMTSEYLMRGSFVDELFILKLVWFGWIKTLTHILHREWSDSLWTELKWLLYTFINTVKMLKRVLAMIESCSAYGPKDEIIKSGGPSAIFWTALSVKADCSWMEWVEGSWYTDGFESCGNLIFLSIAFPSSSTTICVISYDHIKIVTHPLNYTFQVT